MHISTDIGRHWSVNEAEAHEVSDCIDLDLNFSPSTNTIAIRRLKLEVGERRDVTAAWLRFPSFTLEPLAQSYQRLAGNLYRYVSGNESFTADLATDDVGFVIDYPGIWKEELVAEQ